MEPNFEEKNTKKERPIVTGVFAVFAVLVMGVVAAWVTGFATPDKVFAQVFDTPPCCTVPETPPPPVVIPPPPPVIIDTPPCCTVPETPPVVQTPPTPPVVIDTPPCCTVPTTPPVVQTPPPPVVIDTPPCCTVPSTPPVVIDTPPCCTVPITPPVPETPPTPPTTIPVTPPPVTPPPVTPPPVTPPPVTPPPVTPPGPPGTTTPPVIPPGPPGTTTPPIIPPGPPGTTTPPGPPGTTTPPGGGGPCTNCGGGGGGGGGPHVMLASSQPLASVYLSQIPYTGLDLGPVGTVIYWLTLIVWSLAATYLILFAGVPFALKRVKNFGGEVKTALNMPANPDPAPAPQPAPAPAQAASIAHVEPVQYSAPAAPAPTTLAREGFKSFATGEALTIDDIVKGLSRESGMVFSQPEAPTPAPEAQPEPVYAEDMTPRAPKAAAPLVEAIPETVLPQTSVAAQPGSVTYSDDISGFLGALLNGDREAVFGTLRDVNRAGGDTQEFLAHAVCALDDAYRARIDGTPVHPEIARLTANCATSFLERLVSSLATAIDSSYSAGITGAKLAVTRALGIING